MNENKLSQLKCRKKLNVIKVKIKNIYKIKSSNISTYWYLFENKINKRKGKNFKIKIYLGWVQANKTFAVSHKMNRETYKPKYTPDIYKPLIAPTPTNKTEIYIKKPCQLTNYRIPLNSYLSFSLASLK